MTLTTEEFNRRVRALGINSQALGAAKDVLVAGDGYRWAAKSHHVDPGNLHRLVDRIRDTRICPTCGQARQ